ncbi:MAG: hypothetical protein KatS3mg071_1588 [Meiothermus sp.]|nr:MAG: hypothetical protein KatS3mg071_1588 [Meiothermus sp.]
MTWTKWDEFARACVAFRRRPNPLERARVESARKALEILARGGQVEEVRPGVLRVFRRWESAGEVSEDARWYWVGGGPRTPERAQEHYEGAEIPAEWVHNPALLEAEAARVARAEAEFVAYGRSLGLPEGWENKFFHPRGKGGEKCIAGPNEVTLSREFEGYEAVRAAIAALERGEPCPPLPEPDHEGQEWAALEAAMAQGRIIPVFPNGMNGTVYALEKGGLWGWREHTSQYSNARLRQVARERALLVDQAIAPVVILKLDRHPFGYAVAETPQGPVAVAYPCYPSRRLGNPRPARKTGEYMKLVREGERFKTLSR